MTPVIFFSRRIIRQRRNSLPLVLDLSAFVRQQRLVQPEPEPELEQSFVGSTLGSMVVRKPPKHPMCDLLRPLWERWFDERFPRLLREGRAKSDAGSGPSSASPPTSGSDGVSSPTRTGTESVIKRVSSHGIIDFATIDKIDAVFLDLDDDVKARLVQVGSPRC